MAISPQRLAIYLYSAHRAVIFAIEQFSCSHWYASIAKQWPNISVVYKVVEGLCLQAFRFTGIRHTLVGYLVSLSVGLTAIWDSMVRAPGAAK